MFNSRSQSGKEPYVMSDTLRRHRRNLMISNSVLLAAIYVGLEFNETINTPFVSFEVKEPDKLKIILWVVNFYYFVRYYQYYKVEPNKNFKSFWRKELDIYSQPYLLKQIPEGTKPYKPVQDYQHIFYSKLDKINGEKWKRNLEILLGDNKKEEIIVDIIKLWPGLIKTILHITFNRTYLMDYFLPFIYFLFAVWFEIIK